MTNCIDYAFRVFIFIIILAPMIISTIILFIMTFLVDTFILLYFALLGWIIEINKCSDRGCFVDALKCPWKIMVDFFKKLETFFGNLDLDL